MAESTFPKKMLMILSILLMVGSFAFWIGWGITWANWNFFKAQNIGVYAICSVMFLFGLFGFLLLRTKE